MCERGCKNFQTKKRKVIFQDKELSKLRGKTKMSFKFKNYKVCLRCGKVYDFID